MLGQIMDEQSKRSGSDSHFATCVESYDSTQVAKSSICWMLAKGNNPHWNTFTGSKYYSNVRLNECLMKGTGPSEECKCGYFGGIFSHRFYRQQVFYNLILVNLGCVLKFFKFQKFSSFHLEFRNIEVDECSHLILTNMFVSFELRW
jgi:hypothetical protein